MKFGPVVSEEKSFEIVDGWTTEPAYTISSPGAFGSGEIKKRAVTKQDSWYKLAFAHHIQVSPKL